MQSVIGLDIGGSRTHGVRAVDGAIVAEAFGRSANVASVGADVAGTVLAEVVAALGTDGVAAVCAGAAGAGSPEPAALVTELIAQLVPGAAVQVVHDARLLLAAAGLDAGIAVVSGTGSAAWGIRDDGTSARAGGWGYLLGDEGSAYAVAIAAVRHVLGRSDAGQPPDRLTGALLDRCGLDRPEQLVEHAYRHPDRAYWAEHARIVGELAWDRAADTLLGDAAAALAALVRTVTTRLEFAGPVVLAGGFLTHQPRLQTLLRDQLPGAEVIVLEVAPVHGAVRLAQRCLASRAGEAQEERCRS